MIDERIGELTKVAAPFSDGLALFKDDARQRYRQVARCELW
jgi:hypothetical protein